jgi:hypothetical protein
VAATNAPRDESGGYVSDRTELWAAYQTSVNGCKIRGRWNHAVRDDADERSNPPESREVPGSLDLTQIFVEALADVRSRSEQRATDLATKALDYLRREIEGAAMAKRSFEELCAKGCDAQDLLWLLAACSGSPSPEPDRVSLIMGSNTRQLKAIVKEFRQCAARIDSINSAIVGQIFSAAKLRLPYRLPAELREFATLADFVARLNWNTYWTVAKKQLIYYVKQKTGQYHDKRVAEFVATVTDRDYYDQKTHSKWREDNLTSASRLPLPQSESVGFGWMARVLVRTIYLACIFALLVKLSHRERSAPSKSPTNRR